MIELELYGHELPSTKAGNPALPRKNVYYGHRTAGLGKIKLYIRAEGQSFRDSLRKIRLECGAKTIKGGYWKIDLTQFAGRQNHSKTPDLEEMPDLDSDACLWPVRDALEASGWMDDDARIVENTCRSIYRPKDPGIMLKLTEVPADEWKKTKEAFLLYSRDNREAAG